MNMYRADDNHGRMCANCIDGFGSQVYALQVDPDAVEKMQLPDWLVLMAALPVVTMALAAEIRDIQLCNLARTHFDGGSQ
jgi:hypothetical protein